MKVVSVAKDDPRVLEFRRRVICQDCGQKEYLLDEDLGHSYFQENLPLNVYEDAYKFSYRKWSNTSFDVLFASLVQDGSIASLSGSKVYYNHAVRVGMHYYTLKNLRNTVRFPLWRSNGFVDKSMHRFSEARCFFTTIYGHNSRLSALAKRMMLGRFGHLSQTEHSATVLMQKFKAYPNKIKFNQVEQVLFYHLRDNSFNVEDLILNISDK